MSDSIPISPDDIHNLADSVNSLKTGGMLFIVSMTVIILGYMVISKYLTWKKEKTLSEKVRFTIKKQTSNEKPDLLSRKDLEEHCYMIIKSLLKSGSLEEYLVKKIPPRKRK